MKELSVNKKAMVIKLFLEGYAYNEITQRTGVSKGSVVNIINDFRDGIIPLPAIMSQHVDMLRSFAVDLLKNNTTVSKIKSCLKIHTKLEGMGVDSSQIEKSLDIIQQIASPSASNSEFIKAALELARIASEGGLSYSDLLTDYDTKTETVKHLNRRIQVANSELNRVKQEKKEVKKELTAITKKTIAVQKTFDRKKAKLKSVQKQYMKDHRLSWRKIRLVEALVEAGFKGASLPVRVREKIQKQIINTGSVVKTTQILAKEETHLQARVNELVVFERNCALKVGELEQVKNQLDVTIQSRKDQLGRVEEGLESRIEDRMAVEEEINDKKQDLYISRIVLDFLRNPKGISNSELNRLVSMLIALRQSRLGIRPKQVFDGTGKLICQCQVPTITTDLGTTEVDMDSAREALAHYLAPLVGDKFVLKSEHDFTIMQHMMNEKLAYLKGMIEERTGQKLPF